MGKKYIKIKEFQAHWTTFPSALEHEGSTIIQENQESIARSNHT